MKIKRVMVDVPQGKSGELIKGSQFVFAYADENRQDLEIGLSYRGHKSPFVSSVLQPIFSMNLPEGYLAEKIRQRMAKTPYNDLFLLSLIGDNQIGRLSYQSNEFKATKSKAQVSLNDILKGGSPGEIFEFLVDEYFASGISGVQPKVLVPDINDEFSRKTFATSNLIVKSGLQEYEGLSQNEFLCMEAARLSGINTPEYYLSDDRDLFVMKRFDLQGSKKLGFEDIAVLLNIRPDNTGNYKYERSYETISKVIRSLCPNDDSQVENFYHYLCLSIMVRNGDAHLKNFGVLYEHPGEDSPRRISPIYDVTTTTIYSDYSKKHMREMYDSSMALKLMAKDKHKNYPTREELLNFGRSVIGIKKPEEILNRISAAMQQALLDNRDRVNSDIYCKISKEWDKGITLALNPSSPRRNNMKPTTGGQKKARPSTSDPQP